MFLILPQSINALDTGRILPSWKYSPTWPFQKKEETGMWLFTFNPNMNFLFQETLAMFLKMNLTGKITWEVGEKYVYMPVSHTLLSHTIHIGGKITQLIGKK